MALAVNLVPIAGPVLSTWLLEPDWRKRHASLICLAQIAEGCAEKMQEQLTGLVGMCLQVLLWSRRVELGLGYDMGICRMR